MTTTRVRYLLIVALVGAVALAVIGHRQGALPTSSPPKVDARRSFDDVEFTDVRAQARAFMGYNRSIKLTADQEALKREALSALRAACCSDFSAYTCCCKCNLSRTIWGLTSYLIVEKEYDAQRISQKVTEWLHFVNPGGFSGNACFTGGCGRPFAQDGCGGMSESRLAL